MFDLTSIVIMSYEVYLFRNNTSRLILQNSPHLDTRYESYQTGSFVGLSPFQYKKIQTQEINIIV